MVSYISLGLRLPVFLGLGREEARGEARCWDCTGWLDNAGWLDAGGRLGTVHRIVVVSLVRVGGFDEGGAEGASKGEIKVGQHDVAVLAHKDILGFEVAVDDTEHVQVFQGEKNFCYIEPAICKRASHRRT